LASIAIRPSFLIGELRLGKLSETVVVVGDAPHDRPGFLMCHLVGDHLMWEHHLPGRAPSHEVVFNQYRCAAPGNGDSARRSYRFQRICWRMVSTRWWEHRRTTPPRRRGMQGDRQHHDYQTGAI